MSCEICGENTFGMPCCVAGTKPPTSCAQVSHAISQETQEVILDLIHKAMDESGITVERERSLDRVEEEFSCLAHNLPTREPWL